jgi:hypothetical protein
MSMSQRLWLELRITINLMPNSITNRVCDTVSVSKLMRLKQRGVSNLLQIGIMPMNSSTREFAYLTGHGAECRQKKDM